MAQNVLFCDNRDYHGMGLIPSGLSGFLAVPRPARSAMSVPNSNRQIMSASTSTEERTATIRAKVVVAAITDQDTVIRAHQQFFAPGLHALRSMNRPTVQTWAELKSMTFTEVPNARGLTVPSLVMEQVWTVPDGGSVAYPAVGSVLYDSTPRAVTVRSADTLGLLHLWGYTSPVTVRCASVHGARTLTMVITHTLASADDHVVVDLSTGDVWSVTTLGRTLVTTVTGDIPSPALLMRVGTQDPVLSVSSGSALLIPQLNEAV